MVQSLRVEVAGTHREKEISVATRQMLRSIESDQNTLFVRYELYCTAWFDSKYSCSIYDRSVSFIRTENIFTYHRYCTGAEPFEWFTDLCDGSTFVHSIASRQCGQTSTSLTSHLILSSFHTLAFTYLF